MDEKKWSVRRVLSKSLYYINRGPGEYLWKNGKIAPKVSPPGTVLGSKATVLWPGIWAVRSEAEAFLYAYTRKQKNIKRLSLTDEKAYKKWALENYTLGQLLDRVEAILIETELESPQAITSFIDKDLIGVKGSLIDFIVENIFYEDEEDWQEYVEKHNEQVEEDILSW